MERWDGEQHEREKECVLAIPYLSIMIFGFLVGFMVGFGNVDSEKRLWDLKEEAIQIPGFYDGQLSFPNQEIQIMKEDAN